MHAPARPVLPALAAALALASFGAHAATLVVDDDRVQCPSAKYTALQPAIDAARPGDTVKACAGTYAPARIDKPLTLAGPKRGKDARSRTLGGAGEAIVRGPSPLSISGTGVTVDGLSIVVQLDDDGEGRGIGVAGHGHRILNNLFEDDLVSGIIFGITTGETPVTIRRNHFRGRIGIAADSEGAAHNVLIADNLFTNAIVLAVGAPHSDLQILRNRFRYDAAAPTPCSAYSQFACRPLIALSGTLRATVLQNRLENSGEQALALDGNESLTVQDNTLSRGLGTGIQAQGASQEADIVGNRIAGFGGAGIRLVGASGLLVEGNEVEDNASGVELADSTGNQVRANSVEDNAGAGIDAQRSTLNVFQSNEARGNGSVDCRDDSQGGGTLGTANTWADNEGSRSSPQGLCPDR